jgi:hypothetical protein
MDVGGQLPFLPYLGRGLAIIFEDFHPFLIARWGLFIVDLLSKVIYLCFISRDNNTI